MNSHNILESNEISQYVFFPCGRTDFEVHWIKIDNIKLSCYYYLEDESNLTVIVFHGNGESVFDYFDSYLEVFKKLRFNVLLVEYRGYSASSGIPTLVNIVEDAISIFEELKIDKERTIAYGRSLGAIPALNLAVKNSLAGLVI